MAAPAFAGALEEGESSTRPTAAAAARTSRAWFCTTGLPADIVVDVHPISFHLHKFPLMSKSRKIHRMVAEQEERLQEKAEIREDGAGGELYRIALPEFPGGPGAFEAAAKFCYGVKIDLTPWNAAPLRCAAEHLEMTDDYASDNLAWRTDTFINTVVLRRLVDAAAALKSCEELMPLADELGIVDRCVQAIAQRVLSLTLDAGVLFGWPVNSGRGAAAAGDPWVEELTSLSLPMYERVMAAMAALDVNPSAIEGCLVSYAQRSIPGLSRRRHASAPVKPELEQRELLEAVVAWLLPLKSDGDVVTTRLLFAMLRTAHILRASEACRAALERKIGAQLERASVDDMLIPSYSYLVDTLYDVDCILRIIRHSLQEHDGVPSPGQGALARVAKLVDGYLAEVAPDDKLEPGKFCELALVLPDHARACHDGLYRAVDIYLKAHQRLPAEERDRVVGVVDCRKLTPEACTHAAQNERLPLRAILQVLFFEQLQLRRAITGNLQNQMPLTQPQRGGEAWRSTVRENQVLKLDMDTMQDRVQLLERECSSMKAAIQKIDVGGGDGGTAARADQRSRTRCKFSTQVCESHERAVVAASRASRVAMSP